MGEVAFELFCEFWESVVLLEAARSEVDGAYGFVILEESAKTVLRPR